MARNVLTVPQGENVKVFRQCSMVSVPLESLTPADWLITMSAYEGVMHKIGPADLRIARVTGVDFVKRTVEYFDRCASESPTPTGSAEIKHGKIGEEGDTFNPDTSRRFQPTPSKAGTKPVHVLEAKEFISANTLAASVLEAQEDGGISRQSIDRHERAIRDLLRVHRFDVLGWLVSEGVDVPPSAWRCAEHPSVGQQCPDRPRPVAPPAS